MSSAHQPHQTGDPSSQQGGCKAVPVVTSYRARRHGQQRLRQHYLGVTLNGVNRLIETLSSEYCVTLLPYIYERRKQTRRDSFVIHQERRSFSVRHPNTFHRSQDIDLKTGGATHPSSRPDPARLPLLSSLSSLYTSKRVTIEYKLVTDTPVYVIYCVISRAALLASQTSQRYFPSRRQDSAKV